MSSNVVKFKFSPGDPVHWGAMRITGKINYACVSLHGNNVYVVEWSDKDAHVTDRWVDESALTLALREDARLQDVSR